MPSIEKGGVEKNFFAISNFLTDYIEKITIITANNNHNIKINNKIFIKCPSNNLWNNKKRIFNITPVNYNGRQWSLYKFNIKYIIIIII